MLTQEKLEAFKLFHKIDEFNENFKQDNEIMYDSLEVHTNLKYKD